MKYEFTKYAKVTTIHATVEARTKKEAIAMLKDTTFDPYTQTVVSLVTDGAKHIKFSITEEPCDNAFREVKTKAATAGK